MKNWLRAALLSGFYGLWFLVFTWPLGTRLTTAFLADPAGDANQFVWNVWHFDQAIVWGRNPFVTNWLFYPQGTSLLMHTYTPVLGLLGLVVGNPILAVNLGLLLSATASGAGAYLLARRWVRSPVLALLAGFVFAYSPYKLQRLSQHVNLELTATVPFYVLAFLRAFEFTAGRWLPRVRSWGAVAACAGLGVLTLLSDYYVLFGLLYFSLAYAAWFGLRLGRIRWRAGRTWAGLVGLLAVSHVLVRLLRMSGLPEKSIWWGGDLVSFLMPPASSRWVYWDWAARLLHNPKVFNAPGSIENTVFIGYALPLLALLLGILRWWHRRPASARFADPGGRPLAWVLVVFLLFTIPSVRVLGHERLNLPTAALHFIPFLNNLRCPTRWIMMVGLLLPIVSFSALEAAWAGRLKPATQLGFSLLLFAVVLVEFWPRPFPLQSISAVPRAYRQVAQLPGTSLITIPLGIVDGTRQVGRFNPVQLFYQTQHHQKLPTGYISRVSPAQFASLDAEPVLHALLLAQTRPDSVVAAPGPTPAEVRDFLARYRPAAFVVEPAYRNQPVHQRLRQLLLLVPGYYYEQPVDSLVLFAPPGR
ncbi:hypothetical protein [Hymenobacter sp. UYCo722]|uniref:hypothetical protein n=1 Tax=Hymenobacter sp. UYCo722 TaxID=3156335 RepID=UPI00339A205A